MIIRKPGHTEDLLFFHSNPCTINIMVQSRSFLKRTLWIALLSYGINGLFEVLYMWRNRENFFCCSKFSYENVIFFFSVCILILVLQEKKESKSLYVWQRSLTAQFTSQFFVNKASEYLKLTNNEPKQRLSTGN